MRSLSSTTMLAAAGLVLFAAGSLAVAPPAQAQGVNAGNVRIPEGSCPSGWFPGEAKGYCKAMKITSPPAIYVRTSKDAACAAGYYVDYENAWVCTTRAPGPTREQALGKGGKFAKANPIARCPTGWISTNSFTECYTQLENAPAVRAKGAAACAADELNDWDLWCTSNYQHLTPVQAERAGLEDFNKSYGFALGNRLDAAAIPDDELSPAATAYFGGTASKTATAAQSATPAASQAAECVTGSQAGAVIGGALGGRTGAALGGALGGLGKKKKKNGC